MIPHAIGETQEFSELEETTKLLQQNATLPPEQISVPVSPLVAAAATHEKGKNCSVYGTRSADFWSLQYQYCAYVCVSPQLDATQREVWTRAMQYAYGKYIASIKSALHPRVALAIGHEIDKQNHDIEAEMLTQARLLSSMHLLPDNNDDVLMDVISLNQPITCKSPSCTISHVKTGLLVCGDCHDGYHSVCVRAHFEGALHRWYCPEHQVCAVCTGGVSYHSELACHLCDAHYHAKCVAGKGVVLHDHDAWLCPNCVFCSNCNVQLPPSAWSDPVLASSNHLSGLADEQPIITRLCFSCKNVMKQPREEMLEKMACRVCEVSFGSPLPSLSLRTCGCCDSVVHARCLTMTSHYPKGICLSCRSS
eukprot:GHVH01004782.1.p1 GENE.GHVH01004782.1~~GHVH01004782.1.p1  ORF type:complete len:365 (+),score=16.91 GHVH01004782.1:69-1163(+)